MIVLIRLLNMVRILIILKKSLQQLVECLFKYVMKLNYQNAISFEKRPLKKPAKMFKPDRGMLVKVFKEIYDVSKIPL